MKKRHKVSVAQLLQTHLGDFRWPNESDSARGQNINCLYVELMKEVPDVMLDVPEQASLTDVADALAKLVANNPKLDYKLEEGVAAIRELEEVLRATHTA